MAKERFCFLILTNIYLLDKLSRLFDKSLLNGSRNFHANQKLISTFTFWPFRTWMISCLSLQCIFNSSTRENTRWYHIKHFTFLVFKPLVRYSKNLRVKPSFYQVWQTRFLYFRLVIGNLSRFYESKLMVLVLKNTFFYLVTTSLRQAKLNKTDTRMYQCIYVVSSPYPRSQSQTPW